MTYYSTDGTFMRMDFPHTATNDWGSNWTIYMSDGSRIVNNGGQQRLYDRNDNWIQFTETSMTDMFGRSVYIVKDIPNNIDRVYARGFGGTQLMWTIYWRTITVHRQYRTTPAADDRQRGNSSTQMFETDWRVIDRIELPFVSPTLRYTFDYNANTSTPSYGWGEIGSITMPSGAKATYTHQFDGATSPTFQTTRRILDKSVMSKTVTYRSEYDLSSAGSPSQTHRARAAKAACRRHGRTTSTSSPDTGKLPVRMVG
jgi:hypothetical protein